MDLRQLQYFITVAKHKSFSIAAKELFVSQPSITKAIQNLEKELNVNLFFRTQRKVEITEEGNIFLARIEKILYDLEQAEKEVKDISNLTKGSIKLGLPPMIGAYLFPNFITNFINTFPDLELRVFEEGSISSLSLIEKGDLDLGIVILPEAHRDMMNTITLTKEQIVLCLPPNHQLTKSSYVHFSQLKDEKFILLKDDSFHRQFIVNECQKHNFTPNIIFSSNQIETIKSIVSNGVGISFLMSRVVEGNVRIISRSMENPIEIEIGLAWNKNKYLSKASRAFINYITSL